MAFDVRNTDEKPKKKRREGEAVAASPANALRTDIKNGNQATQQEQQTQQSGGLWGGLSGQRSTFDVRTAAQTRHPVWGDLPGRTGGFDVRTAQRQQGGGLWGGLDREETGSFDVRTAAEAMKRPGKKRDPEVVAAQNANRAQVGAMTRMEDEIRENNPLDSLRVGGNNGIISMADYQALVDKYSGYSDIPGMVEDAAGERRDEALELMNSPERMGEEEYRIAVERLIGEVDWDSYNAYRRINEQLKAIADEEGMAEATATRMIGSVEDTARDANAHPVERDLAQRYAEQIRALEEARDTEGSHLLYAGGRFTGGLLGGVIDPISAGYMVVDAASGGKTAEIQRQLSEYFAANPDKNVYNTPIFALPEEIRALGITEADYRRYILTHVEEEYRMHVEEEDGVGLNPVYKKIVGDFVAENLGRQLPAILITYGTGTGSGTGVLGALRAGGWSAAGKRLVSALKGNLSTWIMGAGAAGGTYTQALDEGDSTAQAVARAVSNGFVEGFTEGLFGFDSFDGLKSMMTGSSGSILRNMMSNAARLLIPSGEESLEEVTAGVMNRTIDQLIGGGSDLMPQRLDGGRPMKWFGEGGVFDMAQMGDDALGGFIGGLTLSSAATVTAAAQVMQETQNAREASEILNGVAAYAMPEEMRPVPLNPERATLPEIQANARAIMEWLGKLRTDTSTQMAAETWLVQQMYISDLESQVRGTGALGENDYLARLTYEEQGDSLPTETRPALLETGMAAPAGTPVRAAAEQLQNANERNVLQNVGRLQSMVRARNAGEMVTALRNEGMMRGDTETETEADTETEAAPEDLAYKPGPAAMKATVTTEAGSAEADILGVTGQGKDAVIRMRAADGTEVTVPVAEAEISDENTRALVDHAVELDYAQPMIAAYSRGQDAGVYATGFELAREYGYWNRMTEEQLLKSDVLTGLTDRQKLLAYQLGVDARAARDAQEKEKTAARRERAREAARKAGKAGSVDESAIMGMNLTENQRAGVAASRQVAGALGIKIVWMRSKAELDEMTGSKVYRSDNGAWDPQTMTMYLDINAGVNVEGDMRFAVERTMMHEVTHYVYSFADESLIRAYEDFVITQAMRGDPDGEIRERLEKAKFGSKEREEIVAEASENVTLSEETMTRLAEQNRTLWEKIRDFLKKWVEDLRAALAKAKGTEKNALNAAARAVEAVQEEVDRMFGEALVSAQRNRMEAAQEIAQRAKTVKDATVAVAPEVAEVMESADYHMPEDRMMSLRTTDRWKELHRERYGASAEFEAQAAMIEAFDMRVAEDAVLRYAVPHGIAPTGRAAKGTDTAAPLRGNVEYRYTFDLDTICDRTLQFRMYRSAVEERIGRKLRETESRQLIELMRAYRLMIPCTYCYVENKRMRLADLYAEQIKKRSGELPEGYATPEAVFAEVEKARTIVAGYMDATYNKPENYSVDRRLAGGTFEGYRDFRLPTTEEAAADEVAKKYGITERKAKSVLLGMVSEWNYARSMDVPLNLANEDADWQTDSMNEQVLVFHKNATTSAQGGAKAKGESSFEAYTDQLARISEEDKDFIIGMGGIRKHSSNDFQIQNVQDYMLFFMDLAADKRGGKAWTGHTYTKSIDYAKILV